MFVAGQKGGVGKTTSAVAITDHLAEAGRAVCLIDADRAQADAANRFLRVPSVARGVLAFGSDPDGAVLRLGRYLEGPGATAEFIVVNSPAGASDVLDPLAPALGALAEALGLGITTAWCLGPSPEGISALAESAAGGLMSLPSRRSVLLAKFFGDPAAWAWARSPVREKLLVAGVTELRQPRLTPALFATFSEQNTAAIGDLVSAGGGLLVVERIMLSRWRAAWSVVAAALLGDADG